VLHDEHRDEGAEGPDDVDGAEVVPGRKHESEQPQDEQQHQEEHPPPIRHGERVVLVGTTGSGKSEGGAHLFASHLGQRLVIDPQDHMILGPDALAEDPPPLDVDRPSDIDWRHRTIRYVPRRPGDRREMDALHAAIYRRGNLLVFVDETEDVAPSQGGGAPFHVRKCIKQGRKVRITYVAATQRPLVFPMTDDDDLDVIRRRLGMNLNELSQTLNSLGDYEYLRHTLGHRGANGRPVVLHMPPLPPEALAHTRRHLINPKFSRR
jgi:hypothetical protein